MNRANILLAVIAVSFFLGGLVEPFVPHPEQPLNEATVVQNILTAVLSFAWCKAHAASRGIAPPSGSAVLAALLPPVGVPVYFFRSMPWRVASFATLKAVGFFTLLLVLFQTGFYVAKSVAT